ncbi:Lrp/AsnC family transcriptional regulator [Shinella zoogloeoides]|jgi:Lrp/AsnC family leucine-responsive transcriptional regulator|uniref:Lrp/AsnC family transcriptional regulator n=1 Tax=Shinella zoogloeoides TaxID=352475 RepID=UPI001F58CFAB|nr:Lrp/AsnC family transcriptional regulator [Shinella zoogloeoides]
MTNWRLDQTDIQILDQLQKNARISNNELAKAAGLSPSPCSRRVQELEASGVIKSFNALLDPRALNLKVNVFITVKMERQLDDKLFEQKIVEFPEVMDCYYLSGSADYILRVILSDLEEYNVFLSEKIGKIPGVRNITSSFALKQVVHRTSLPLPQQPPET